MMLPGIFPHARNILSKFPFYNKGKVFGNLEVENNIHKFGFGNNKGIGNKQSYHFHFHLPNGVKEAVNTPVNAFEGNQQPIIPEQVQQFMVAIILPTLISALQQNSQPLEIASKGFIAEGMPISPELDAHHGDIQPPLVEAAA